jgi:hypothetical protein
LHSFHDYQANLQLDWLNVTQVLPLDIVFTFGSDILGT